MAETRITGKEIVLQHLDIPVRALSLRALRRSMALTGNCRIQPRENKAYCASEIISWGGDAQQ